LGKIAKVGRNLGYASLALNALNLVHSYNSDGITASQAVDLAVGVGLSLLTITNPAFLIGFGVYGLLDAAGAFDGIKESLRGDTVIFKAGK
jgi:hypothetical protein